MHWPFTSFKLGSYNHDPRSIKETWSRLQSTNKTELRLSAPSQTQCIILYSQEQPTTAHKICAGPSHHLNFAATITTRDLPNPIIYAALSENPNTWDFIEMIKSKTIIYMLPHHNLVWPWQEGAAQHQCQCNCRSSLSAASATGKVMWPFQQLFPISYR